MNREYRYRRFVRWGQYVVPVFCGLITVALWLLVLAFVYLVPEADKQDPSYAAIFAKIIDGALLISCECVLGGGMVGYLYYRLAGVSIVVDGDAVIYRYRGGEIRLPFDERMSLAFYFVPYIGGSFIIRSDKQRIRVQDAVEGKASLVREVKAALDVRGLTHSYDHRRLFLYVKASEFGDQLWERSWGGFWKLALCMLANGLLGLVFALVQGSGEFGAFLWIMGSVVWPVAIMFVTEVTFARRLARLSDEVSCTCPPRDRTWERTVYRRAVLWALSLYLAVALTWLLASGTFAPAA